MAGVDELGLLLTMLPAIVDFERRSGDDPKRASADPVPSRAQ
jgi:hypothetical protein